MEENYYSISYLTFFFSYLTKYYLWSLESLTNISNFSLLLEPVIHLQTKLRYVFYSLVNISQNYKVVNVTNLVQTSLIDNNLTLPSTHLSLIKSFIAII